jgi:hypothetical protein
MSFPAGVLRWKPYISKYLAGMPLDFVLAWIQHESGGLTFKPNRATGGKNPLVTSLDERGITQIHPSERGAIGISDSDWAGMLIPEGQEGFIGWDKWASLAMKHVLYLKSQATNLARKNSLSWVQQDFLALVKLMHGLPSIASKGLPAYTEANGTPPPTWESFASWIRNTGWTIASNWAPSRISTVLGNAESVAQMVVPTTVGLGLIGLLVIGGLGWWLLKTAKVL